MAELGIGSVFAGHRIEAQIGEGGMGIVYLAEHLRLSRDVALKVVRPEMSTNPEFRERFAQEAQLAAAIDHPNIIPVYDAGEFDGSLYLTMKYVPGRNLRTVIDTESPLGPAWSLTILEQVGSALDAAHQQGLVHRDVKPANILLPLHGDHCYLTDFGLTKRTNTEQSLTRQGFFLGTLDYAAPEQIKGLELDGRVDVYALGCVLYECLTAHRPYERDSDLSLVWAHVNDPPPVPSASRPDLGTGWDPVIARAMSKDPNARYPDCASLIAGARGALPGAPLPADVATTKVLPVAAGAAAAGAAEAGSTGPVARGPEGPGRGSGGFGGAGGEGAGGSPPGGRRALPWIAAVVGVLLAAGVIGFLATRGGRGPQTVATTPVGATSSATSGATSGTSAPTSGPTSGATSAPTSGASTGPTTGPTTATTTAPTTGPTSGPSRTTGTSGPGPDPQVVAARAVARQFVADVNAHPQSSPAACQDLVRIARYSPATPQALCHGFSDVVHTTLHIHDAVPTGTGLVVVGYETVACQQTSGGLQTSTFEGAWTVDPVQGVIVESHRSPVSVVPGCG